MLPKALEENIYGRMPDALPNLRVETLEQAVREDGTERRQLRLTLSREERNIAVALLLVLPGRKGPYPVLLSANLNGNHSTTADPAVRAPAVPSGWMTTIGKPKLHRAHGTFANRFPVDELVKQGFAAATFFYGEAEPEGLAGGVRTLYPELSGKTRWGSIRAWAWALSRAIDALAQESGIDGHRIALYGFSRAGKAALVAAADDNRVAAVVAEGSGKAGGALSSHRAGEPLWLMTRIFSHWFVPSPRFTCDQDVLLRAIAPRPVLLIAGSEDSWTDPVGQRMAANRGGAEFIMREGKHEPTADGWKQTLAFLKERLQSSVMISA